MSTTFVKAIAITAFVGGLAAGAVGCGGPEAERPEQEALGVEQSGLSVTQSNVTAGECTVTVGLNRSGTSLVGTCSDSCKRDSSVTLRFYIERPDATVYGGWNYVAFSVTGHDARTGGSTTATALNQPTGTYRARCWITHSDTKQFDTSADVIAGPATF
ncbi:hypothetical protein [Archangium sp.]|uniref:hypothetical protein n=1 Tax=Archangium sp. TaxID=1872627 RepID=UPI002D56FA9E|nr:hypothetical protein [Archangium sp.]HYO57264.1 hypothetical protein [Archangium sp.]